MPPVLPGAGIPDVTYPLLDGLNPTLGWQSRPPAKGGPAFMIIRRTLLRPLQVVESFPLTKDGWAAAWRSLVRQNPAATRPRVLAKLGPGARRRHTGHLARGGVPRRVRPGSGDQAGWAV